MPALLALALGLAAGAPPPAEPPPAGPGTTVLLRAGADREVAAPADLGDPVRWFALDALVRDYDNVRHCGRPATHRCHDPLRYRRRALPALDGRRTFRASELPELRAAGTHRIVPAPAVGEGEVGEEALAGAITIVVRPDESYVGYVSELIGVPFVYWPDELPGAGHQTDLRLGADCVATVIYGRRRQGCATRYVAPAVLYRIAAPVPLGADGKPQIRAGDILHFGFQTAVLAEDRPPVGELDDGDLVLHAYHGLVERVPFGALPYRGYTYRVLRWPECQPPRDAGPGRQDG